MNASTPPQPEASYQELLWPLVLGGNAIGRLDWLTGVLSLDVSKEAYESMSEAHNEEERTAATAYTHEYVHVLQIALCGFPFRWSTELFELVRPAVVRLRAGRGDKDFGPLLDAIKLGGSAFSFDEAKALNAHFAKLDEPCSIGITTRSLLESHAHVVQRRINYKVSNFSELAPHLAEAPGAEYRAAFDALAFATHPTVAYEWFPLVCSVALCTERPAVSYNRLLLALADTPDYLPEKPTRDNALQAQRDLADIVDSELIGSSSQVAMANKNKAAPLFRLVEAVEDAFQAEAFDPSWAYAAPHEEISQLVSHLHVPVFLRPVDPQGFAVRLPPGMDYATALFLLTVAAISCQLTRVIDSKSRVHSDQALDGLDWLRGDLTPILLQLSSQMLADNDLIPSLTLADPATNRFLTGRQMARLWGRVVLLGPEELDPEGRAVLPNLIPVRAYLSALNKRFPAFPAILSWRQGMSNFVDWFGSVVPQAMNGNALILNHPDVLEAVRDATMAIQKLGKEASQNPSLAIQLMTLPLQRLPD